MHRIIKLFGWSLMLILSIGVAGYAFAFLAIENLGSSDLKTKFATIPFAAYSHILGGAVALALGSFQFSSRLRQRFLVGHRWLGRVYLAGILFGGIGGLVLAFYSDGGMITHWGFGLLAVAWLFTGMQAYRAIRAGRINKHRAWMIRNFALTLAAVMLRIYLPLFAMTGMEFIASYRIISWLCWVPNLLVAEWRLRTQSYHILEESYLA
jgi:uncharacterized membrane protein